MANTQTLRELLVDEIRDLYSAERQLTKALPKMVRAASSDELRQAFQAHLEETQAQIERLDSVFESLDEKPRAKHCEGMAGIIEEGSSLMGEDFDGAVLDAGLIASAQRVEHYEIGAYGSVVAWAKALGLNDVARMLDETLAEEKATDEKLNALAEGSINAEAASGANGEDEEMGRGMSANGRQGRGRQSQRAGGSRSNNGRARSSGGRKSNTASRRRR